jgi:hypothetical protein
MSVATAVLPVVCEIIIGSSVGKVKFDRFSNGHSSDCNARNRGSGCGRTNERVAEAQNLRRCKMLKYNDLENRIDFQRTLARLLQSLFSVEFETVWNRAEGRGRPAPTAHGSQKTLTGFTLGGERPSVTRFSAFSGYSERQPLFGKYPHFHKPVNAIREEIAK